MKVGLDYICATAERFFAVSAVLNNMVGVLPENPSVRLLKHIIRCYLRLSDNARAREALRQCLPPLLMDPGFTSCLKEDIQTRQYAAPLTSFMLCISRGLISELCQLQACAPPQLMKHILFWLLQVVGPAARQHRRWPQRWSTHADYHRADAFASLRRVILCYTSTSQAVLRSGAIANASEHRQCNTQQSYKLKMFHAIGSRRPSSCISLKQICWSLRAPC